MCSFPPLDLQLIKPQQVPVEIGRDASFKDLRHLLARWMGTEPDNVRCPTFHMQAQKLIIYFSC